MQGASSALDLAEVRLADPKQPSYPAGLELYGSDCASGGFEYFFFADGGVIAQDPTMPCPTVQLGTWKRVGADVEVRLSRAWGCVGRGRVVEHASADVYEDYVARAGPVRAEPLRFAADAFAPLGPRAQCEYVIRHARPQDPYAFLRQFGGDHPETFLRALTRAELADRSADELRLMRNEIFARYGYRFKDAALLERFRKNAGYRPGLSNVDAFLSELERANVATLLAAESAASRSESAPR
jgi:hypothetical protein